MNVRIVVTSLLSCLLGVAIGVGYGKYSGSNAVRSSQAGDRSRSNYRAKTASVIVSLQNVSACDISATLSLTGNLLPKRRTILVSEVDGVIESVPDSRNTIQYELDGQTVTQPLRLDMGQQVNQGDVLVQIHRGESVLRLKAAEANLAKVNRDLQQLRAWKRPEEIRMLQATLSNANASFENATAELSRARQLVAQNAMSHSEVDRIVAQEKLSHAGVEKAVAALEMANKGPTQEQIAVAQAAIAQAQAEVDLRNDELNKTTITAPYDAVITDRYVDEGEYVSAQPRVELMELMDLAFLTVQVGIPERYLNRVHSGDEVRVFIEGSSGSVRGVVFLVNDKVEPESRSYRTRIGIDNRDGRFKAGQFARVEFIIESEQDALVVSNRAIVYTGGQPQVFVMQEGHANLKAVDLGIANDTHTEIKQGLEIGQSVIVDDPAILADGMKVEVRQRVEPDKLAEPVEPASVRHIETETKTKNVASGFAGDP